MAQVPVKVTRDTPYVKLSPSSILELKALDVGDKWKELAAVITSRGTGQLKFNYESICLIEVEGRKPGRSPTELVLDGWSTDAPTVGLLIDKLLEAKLISLARYLAVEVLKEDAREFDEQFVSPNFSALSQVSGDRDSFKTMISEDLIPTPALDLANNSSETDAQMNDLGRTFKSIDLHSTSSSVSSLTKYCQSSLESITDNFNETPLHSGGRFVGEGGFGKVYLGKEDNCLRAVKVLNDTSHDEKFSCTAQKQFAVELGTLASFQHANILSILGYSDEVRYCLVYPYMTNGSFEDRLQCLDGTSALSPKLRMSILREVAGAIHFLHKQNQVHRDVKSANILLDDNMVAKLADFGLAREVEINPNKSCSRTSISVGTAVYMPPEAYSGEVSPKWDVYSFGVVILEALTGLPPNDKNREDNDLSIHLSDCEDIAPFLDTKGGHWDTILAIFLFALAKSCLRRRRRERPEMLTVASDLVSPH